MESDLYAWLDSILMDIGESSKNATPSYTIQKAPDRFRKLQPSGKNWYDPILVSIGPFHHRKPDLQSVEELKSHFAREFLVGEEKRLKGKEICVKVLKEVHELRKCYAEGSTNGYDDLSFTKMMFLDGCFILQFLD
ncbi:hypothetical protein RHMOL_Rhmol04G0149900 [Rhododendron molle]|uniref:Uncharacterized protein n=1 Tax=Rhododendron molle TaxID=49168 RepID=A0ACC0P2D6_RHOML|nr:hypothetical protein RHMOL_Rhmol04G0149900 [Rhododendron molle]